MWSLALSSSHPCVTVETVGGLYHGMKRGEWVCIGTVLGCYGKLTGMKVPQLLIWPSMDG